MRTTSGVKLNWPVIAIAGAFIAVPVSIGLIQDLGREQPDPLEDYLAQQRVAQAGVEAAGEPEDPGPPDDPEMPGEWNAPAMDQAFYDQVLLGGPDERAPALRGPLARIRWGMPAKELPQPFLVHGSVELVPIIRSPGEIVVGFDLRFKDDGTARRLLAARWGAPRSMIGVDGQVRHAWFEPKGRLMVQIEELYGATVLTFTRHLPAAELIREDGRLAFETHPILGSSRSAIERAYGSTFEVDAHEVGLDCLPVAFSYTGNGCGVRFDERVARGIHVDIDYSYDTMAGPEIFAALRGRLGEPTSQSSGASNVWTFRRGFSIEQIPGKNQLLVRRTR